MREHKFVDKHPIAAAVLLCLFLMLFREIISSIPAAIHGVVFGPVSDLPAIIYMLIGVFAAFAFYKWWFAPQFEGALKGGCFKEGLLSFRPFLIYWLITAIIMLIENSFELKTLSLTTIRVSLTAGFAEELSFRNGIISTLFRNRNQKDLIIRNCLVSSVVFGLFHALNIFGGAEVIHTLIQVVSSAGIGFFFAAVYARYGNLWPCIIFHAVHDIYAISISPSVSESGLISGKIYLSDYIDLLCCIALGVYACCRILAPEQREQIVELWNKKWKNERFEAVETKQQD